MDSKKKRLIIDMDETIADSLARQLEWYERDAAKQVARDELKGRHLYQAVGPEHEGMVYQYPHHEDFFDDLPLLDGAQEALLKLSEVYDIYIATAAMEFPPFVHAEVRVAAAALSLHLADALHLLRGQEHPQGRLPD